MENPVSEVSNKLKVLAALAKFQEGCPVIKKDEENPYFKSSYADLKGIWETIRPILTKHGLIVIQPVIGKEVRTTLYHTSGEFLTSAYPVIYTVSYDKEGRQYDDPQKFGAAVTYARRYSLSALLGIQTEEDDDGNKAAEPTKYESKKEVVAGMVVDGLNGIKTKIIKMETNKYIPSKWNIEIEQNELDIKYIGINKTKVSEFVKEGATVEITDIKKTEKNGKTYWNAETLTEVVK